ncbi:MAG: helicase-exonuclease AddAB subunit AddA [Lachnospiraceae bacterium]|nr:helicase-exonuclease AddAB subunit AddA [Lachnospiraceae bacterium]
MAVQWTEEQQQVISLREANILVSAAAGSGKTAVLVQRIIDKVMDQNHPVNIDQMVIVTFTQAAAGEMRERIQAAIEKEAALHPENEHLQRQRTRIHMANISTIHSFCKHVIQNHFQEIDLEPSFRIGDEGELKLMKKEVLSLVLEDFYTEGSEEFYRFTETFSSGKSDDRIEEIVLTLYDFAMSYPYPRQWLEHCRNLYTVNTYEELMQTEWMQILFAHQFRMLEYTEEKLVQARKLLEGFAEAENYQQIFDYYASRIQAMKAECDYSSWQKQLENLTSPALPKGKKSCPDAEVREEVKGLRDEVKEILEKMREVYFQQSAEQILEDLSHCAPVIEMLIQAVLRFQERFQEEKHRQNLLDFNDLEHEALHILRNEEGEPTETAKEYAEFFEEILIDEYQDSNLVQEYLLTSISKQPLGGNNLFMVGDAKQSIYRFRLARPELFMEKYHTYSLEEGPCRRIDLHKNFRSRGEVLDSANYIFEKIMKRSLGGIDYDHASALYQGMEFATPVHEGDYTTELLLFDRKNKDLDIDSIQYESKLIAHRIKALVDEETGLDVLDKREGTYRKARYRDIAILLRSTGGFDTILLEELAAEGIPAHMLSREGYFDTLEITTMLNYLRIIDNPLQDIPLLSVLKSPFVGLDDEELVKIRIEQEEVSIYQCVQHYMEEGEEEALRIKLSEFFAQLQQFRMEMCYMPIHKFICHILDATGYGDYIGVMPGGGQKKANMEMLVEKAAAFEETSYAGVFQFIRYMEQLEKYKIDTGEASIISENDDTVRIMTIHKSKGLEFPIVIAAGLGRKFNKMESRQPLVIHHTLGLGMEHVLLETRQKNKTLLRSVILLQNQLESLGEELRVLYVALTRAREKLILTGGVDQIEKCIKRACRDGYSSAPDYGSLTMAGSYMEWILAALSGHPDAEEEIRNYISTPPSTRVQSDFPHASFLIREIQLSELIEEDLQELVQEERMNLQMDMEKSGNQEELPEKLRERLEYQYQYEEQMSIPAKVTVSELKRAQREEPEEGHLLYPLQESVKIQPSFLQQERAEVSAVNRGTAYHKVFECLDLDRCESISHVEEQLEHFYENGILEERMRAVIRPRKIWRFACSEIGRRMRRAQTEGKLYKEQPFVYAVPACEINDNWDSQELIMVQGIIDVFFEEEGELVLLDYKTDYIKEGQESMLSQRYRIQFEYYQRALQEITGKRVKELVLYSVFLEKEIIVETTKSL